MKNSRLRSLAMAGILALIGAVWIAVDYHTHPCLLAGPMVQLVTPEGFTVVWRMHPNRPTVVAIRDSHGIDLGEFPASLENEKHGPGQYVASATGLDAGSTYHYEIIAKTGSEERTSLGEHRVRTAPQAKGSFRFLAFGDSGAGQRAQRQLARLMPEYDADLIIHTGDIISPRGAREDFTDKFYRPYARLLATTGLYPCLGNHEYRTENGQPVLDAFVLPQNGPTSEQPERHYWFDFGPARFVAIDTNHDQPLFRDVVAPWLDDVLASAGDRWKIIFFHEPIFTNGKHKPADKLLHTLVPVFDRRRVDLVLVGHNHLYERTYPLRGQDGCVVASGHGTVHVTTGAGGNNLYKAKMPRPPFIAGFCDDQHSFTVADVTPTTIMLRQVGITGQLVDTAHITRAVPATSVAQLVQ